MRKSTLVWCVVPDMKGSLKGPFRLAHRTNETILSLKLKLKPARHKKCMTLLVTKTESQIVVKIGILSAHFFFCLTLNGFACAQKLNKMQISF